jgi:cytochrome c biogenesis protein CcmG/thiol:disulfide interchange protein DsbE
MRLRARWIALMVAAVLVAFGVVLAVQHRSEPSVPRLVQEHRPVPSFHVTTLDGKNLDASALAHKTVVVNFFNSWCIPCRQEAPALTSFYAEHKNDADFLMLGVVRDDDPATLRSYVAAQKIDWPVALGGADQAALDFGTTGQPETYVIAPDGVAVCGTLGPSTQAQLDTWLTAARAGQECT